MNKKIDALKASIFFRRKKKYMKNFLTNKIVFYLWRNLVFIEENKPQREFLPQFDIKERGNFILSSPSLWAEFRSAPNRRLFLKNADIRKIR